MLFQPRNLTKMLYHLQLQYRLIKKMVKKSQELTEREHKDLANLPDFYDLLP
jgi:hypothetical protein